MNSMNRRVLAGFAAALTLFLAISLSSWFPTRDFFSASRQATQAYWVLGNLADMLHVISEAKSRHRDFLLTSQQTFLRAYRNSLFSISEKIKELQKMAPWDARQQAKLEQLKFFLSKEMNDSANEASRQAAPA